MPTGVFVMAGLMVLVVFILLALFTGLYRKAGPHEALVVYGFRGTRIVKGHGTVIFPMVESCHELSLERRRDGGGGCADQSEIGSGIG